MPVSRENQKLYPGGSLHSKAWQKIRWRTRDRAVNLLGYDGCEICRIPAGPQRRRNSDNAWIETVSWPPGVMEVYFVDPASGKRGGSAYGVRGDEIRTVKIILTTMHMDHDPGNSDPANLTRGCQLCHNRHDAPHRAANARETRQRARATANL